MPDKDDEIIYWVPSRNLVFANDSKAADNPYWLCFREAGEELFRVYHHSIDLPQEVESVWSTPTFQRMQQLYKAELKKTGTSKGAFRVIRRYQALKFLGQYNCEPIGLLTAGDGKKRDALDCHSLEIASGMWHYSELDGNHRLMSAFYLGLNRVPVTLRSVPQNTAGDDAKAPG